MEKNKQNKGHSAATNVTFPVSDTVPAPGNYSVEVLDMNGENIPVVNSTDLIDSMGAGSAKDITSALQAPEPGKNFAAVPEEGNSDN